MGPTILPYTRSNMYAKTTAPVRNQEVPLCQPFTPSDWVGDAVTRIDKNAHTLTQSPLAAAWATLEEYTIKQPKTFELTSLNGETAALELQLNYSANYPHIFRRRGTQFPPEMIPSVAARGKAKCHKEGVGISCPRPNHLHHRVVVNTSMLPVRHQNRVLVRPWAITKQRDPEPNFELWKLCDLREHDARSRSRLAVVEDFRHVCARCRKEKELCCRRKMDVGAMFTTMDMDEAQREMPRILKRVRQVDNATTCTVIDGPREAGRVGGSRWGSYQRNVCTRAEMMRYPEYEEGTNLLGLGGAERTRRRCWCSARKKGSAIGGRFSKFKASVVICKRES